MRIRFHENVKFCPRCGVEAIERDYYKQAPPRKNGGGEKGVKQLGSGTEWLCKLCGFGFRIDKSCRWEFAQEMHKRDRQLRNNCQFNEKSVGVEIAQKYNAASEPGLTPEKERI